MIITFHDHQGRSIQLTDNFDETDSPYKLNKQQVESFEKSALLLINHDKHTEKKLKQSIKDYPGVPQFKNQLVIYYALKGKQKQLFEYNRQTLKEHPDYLIARLNLAVEYFHNAEFGNVPPILGDTLNLLDLYPDRHAFHTTEYASYYKVIIDYLCRIEEPETALSIVMNLEELIKKHSKTMDLEAIVDIMPFVRMKVFNTSYSDDLEEEVNRDEPTLPQTTKAPSFHFKQMEWLYENNLSIETKKVEELLQLERGPLIEDLGTILMDTVRRYKYFAYSEYDAKTYDTAIYALLLLQELEAHEALPTILEFLRQPEELLDFWLSDFITENVWQVIHKTGKNQLPLLEAFLKEPLNYTYARTSVSTAISQLAIYEPERRSEVLAVYKNLLDHLYENKENREVSNYSFNTFIIGDIVDFKGTELLGDMKRFYQEELVDEFMEGTWRDVEKRLEAVKPGKWVDEKREIESIYDVLSLYRKIEEKRKDNGGLDDNSYTDDFFDYEDVTQGDTLLYSDKQPYVREGKKIGRNDPCPCGSGLKYKKCHGKNES